MSRAMLVGDYSKRSISNYLREIRFIGEYYPDKPLSALSKDDITNYMLYLKQTLGVGRDKCRMTASARSAAADCMPTMAARRALPGCWSYWMCRSIRNPPPCPGISNGWSAAAIIRSSAPAAKKARWCSSCVHVRRHGERKCCVNKPTPIGALLLYYQPRRKRVGWRSLALTAEKR